MNKLIGKKTYIIFCISLFYISILSQIFLIPKLPNKYFYDSSGILSISNNIYTSAYYMTYFDRSYLFTGNFFRLINIFNFTEFFEWSLFITIIMGIISSVFLLKYKKIRFHQLIFVLITILFANIYLFRISKDFIQLLFWGLIYLIGTSKISKTKKNVLIFTVFLIETVNFRSYYIIIGILYIVLNHCLNNPKKINYKKSFLVLIISIFVSLSFLKILSPVTYNQIINMRYNQNFLRLESGDSITAINDLLPSTNVFNYMINYLVNLFRILFPLELILKGVKYIPFIIYQIYFTITVLLKTKNEKDVRYNNSFLAIIIAYILVSNLFEPDFGSVIRHEVSLYFIFLEVFLFRKVN